MPVYWYYDDGTTGGGWITTSTPTLAATTSTLYLTIGGTTTGATTVTQGAYYQPSWETLYTNNSSNWLGADRSWQVAVRRVREEQARPASPPIIRERMEAETRRLNEISARRREQQATMAEAGKRARELLLEHLMPEQRRMFEANNWFLVEGGRSREQYRIRAGNYAGNVEIMKNGRATHRLCGHCEPSIPLGDQILAQKLMIEHAEDDFLRIANRSSMAL